jgi:hypothetical protein
MTRRFNRSRRQISSKSLSGSLSGSITTAFDPDPDFDFDPDSFA